jgi:hypothetical protein
MTASKNLKRIIRRRMRRTGESYTASRRHFLGPKDSHMTKQATQEDETILDLSIDQLALTLKTTQALKAQGIGRIGQLVEKAAAGINELGLDREGPTEVREVLASRGL